MAPLTAELAAVARSIDGVGCKCMPEIGVDFRYLSHQRRRACVRRLQSSVRNWLHK